MCHKNIYEGGSERPRKMVLVESIGKYRVGWTIGEGSFAKVKLAVDMETGGSVAVKVIDRSTVLRNNLMYQVKREISAMKLLNHPNIVKIHEVIATKTKICLVMEYVPGGQLSDRLSYHKRLNEREANKYFYQLIDAVDYCHRRGVFHRDLKPENLLLDNQGNLKVSDFGLSVLRKPGQLLSTSCGSPCYVAPEVIQHKTYEGAAADIWSCGVILFELLTGYLPFQDHSFTNLYRRISRGQFAFPQWITLPQKKIILSILDPSPITKTKLGSPHAVQETLKMIRVAARDVSLSVRRMSNSMVKLQDIRLLSRSMLDLTLSAEVIEVTEAHCVVEVSKSTGDLRAYKEFCTSLWRLLNEEQCGSSSNIQDVSMVGGTLCTKHLVLNE
ncbi:hypothetical protein QYE76_059126 [Lolium multiflorum]|uniref:non-specific serine/threonine protein kinase n=1 Tax=Lolium multiflorum TaxID=4521 RepID=A0AAD8VC48_LOLMU|nr:hypothetical protein QYE76_059126 [Lolium multiflorum]